MSHLPFVYDGQIIPLCVAVWKKNNYMWLYNILHELLIGHYVTVGVCGVERVQIKTYKITGT